MIRREYNKAEFESLLRQAQENIDLFTRDEITELQAALETIRRTSKIESARTNFRDFVELCGNPVLKFSSKGQHDEICRTFEDIVDGDLKRAAISLPPRFGKSEFGSICLPAWFIGKRPSEKVMQISATEDLATDFGRKVKYIIDSPIYRQIFPGVSLSKDSKASGKFATNKGGEYNALGLNSNLAGKGGHLVIVDDPTTEQQACTGDPSLYDAMWDLFLSGPIHRLQAGGRIIVIQTRWSKADLIGRLKEQQAKDKNLMPYRYIEFPALDENGESNFPEVWPTKELQAKKDILLQSTPQFWFGPYQQDPVNASGSRIPQSLWRPWEQYKPVKGSNEVDYVPPQCSFVLMVFDTAETMNKRSNPTACTIWGLFDYKEKNSDVTKSCCILLHSYCEKLEFHLLKAKAKEWIKEWKPDSIIVEAKSTGPALRAELAEAGIFTTPKRPKPGDDKMVRLASVSDVFHSGRVFYIPTAANMVTITQVADFPNGREDDLVDTVSYAVMEFRQGGLVSTKNDELLPEESEDVLSEPRGYYY